MVAKYKGNKPVKKGGANKPSGKPVASKPQPVVSPYSQAKQNGGSANIGSGIGNS